jgi:hypothetical protein
MNEMTTVYQSLVGGLAAVIASFLYSLGGRGPKPVRRFIAPLIIALAVNGIALWRGNWHWQLPIVYPCLVGGFCMGYGADTLGLKILRRSIYTGCVLVASGFLVWAYYPNSLWLLIPNAGVGAWSIYMGVKNPVEASSEEFLVCLFLTILLPFYPMV